ncbi:MAG: serine hydroxymethyltransferase [Candidatus Parcubacteria bacterium]|nr:serine hydroxymethyltransferase [Candidatus Parcubacteria bacterium]
MKDKEIEKLIKKEKERQKKVVNLIASENFVSADVLTALGSELTNKYAEGYPGKRYYGGNEVTDEVETLCRNRALKLFKLNPKNWAVNVQPLSGSPANLAVYSALVPLGRKIMGMSLAHGGHLTHGQKVSFTGNAWKGIPFGLDKKTERINYEELLTKAMIDKPDIIVAGFTAYPRKIDFKKFRNIADLSGAILMVDMSHFAGLVAGGEYPSPFKYADVVTTTTHKTLRGPRAALIFSKRDERGFSEKIDKAIFPGLQGGPHMNAIAGVAVALGEADTPAFKVYAKQVIKNAQALATELKKRGWRIISGGTDSHLILIDTWLEGPASANNSSSKATVEQRATGGRGGITGKEASERLEKDGIIVNKNAIPFDTRKPFDPSGIRLGTAAETTRGMKEKDMIKLAGRIDKILRA